VSHSKFSPSNIADPAVVPELDSRFHARPPRPRHYQQDDAISREVQSLAPRSAFAKIRRSFPVYCPGNRAVGSRVFGGLPLLPGKRSVCVSGGSGSRVRITSGLVLMGGIGNEPTVNPPKQTDTLRDYLSSGSSLYSSLLTIWQNARGVFSA